MKKSKIIFFSIILIFFTTEHYKPKKAKLKKSIQNTVKTAKSGFKHIIKTPVLRVLMLGSIFGALMLIGKQGVQPFLVDDLGMPLPLLGIMFSLMGITGMITPFLSKLIKTKIKPTVITIVFLSMLTFAYMYFVKSYTVVIVIYSFNWIIFIT